MAGTRVLLVHSFKLFRDSLKALIDDEADMLVTAQTANAGDVAHLVEDFHPEVVLIEAGMAGPSPIEAARHVCRLHPATKVLFISHFEDDDVLFECMQAGASGFLSKASGAEELLGAIREVSRGGKYLTAPHLSQFVDGWRVRKRPDGDSMSTLTAREREVLKLLAEGNSVKECAAMLNLSNKTVEAHKFNLMRKLDIHNKAHLVHYAYQKKIVRLTQMAS